MAQAFVTDSMEFQRIRAIPRRLFHLESYEDCTPLFAKTGEYSLRPIQSAALIEAAKTNGLFAPIGVGFGKGLISLLLPEALDSKKSVLLIPSTSLKAQLYSEIRTFYHRHFHLPIDRIVVVTYSELSSANNANILEELYPFDTVIADECHFFRHPSSARTKRFLRFMKAHPHVRFCGLSGTITSRSIKDYAHLIELALRKSSPLPRGYREMEAWAGVLDVNAKIHVEPGALRQLCAPGEEVRQGYRRRLVETEGVVATSESSLGTSLIVQKLSFEMPLSIKTELKKLTKTWKIEDDEIEQATRLASISRQLVAGFYYKWVWPNNKKDFDWLEARNAWHCEVREKLKFARPGMDSVLLLAQAAEQGRWASQTWDAWKAEKHKPGPKTVPVWLDDFLIDRAIAWGQAQDQPAIIWYEWKAVGERLAQKTSWPHFGEGTVASFSKDPIIICSIQSQGTGKNLQHFCRNLFTTLPPNGTTFEQTVGRTHRMGQLADEVTVDWFCHADVLSDAMKQVMLDAVYQEDTTPQKQKILYATKLEMEKEIRECHGIGIRTSTK